jgi:hypothetical protein
MRFVLKALLLVSVFVIMTSDIAFSQHGAQTLYLQNGQKIACDHSWMEGDTLFVVPQGKRYAISYEKREIDLQRTSVRIQDNVNLQESSVTEAEDAPSKGQRSLHTVYHEHYSIAREPSRPGLNEQNSNVDALPPSTNKGFGTQSSYRSTGSSSPRVNPPQRAYSGSRKASGIRSSQAYQAQQQAHRKQQQDYQQRQKAYETQKQQIEEYNKQVQKNNKRVQRHNAAVKRRNENAAENSGQTNYSSGPVELQPWLHNDYHEMIYNARPLPQNPNPTHHERNR